MLVSYPFISMDEMKAILKERGFNAEYADALTRSDITAAVQFAIWKYANRSTPLDEGEYDGMTVYGGTGEVIDYYNATSRLITSMHDYRNELWNWYNTGFNRAARYMTYDEEIAERVDALTEFLTSLPGVDAPDNQIVISDVKVTRSALVEGSADTYDIDLNILLNHGTANGDVTIYVITSPDENPTLENATDYKEIHVSDASEYSLTVTAKYGDTVRVIVDGTQELPKGVYLYEPKGGVETSQSFVGVGEGETRVHAEDSFVFEKEGDMGVRVFKTVKGSQIPILDITFSVYTVVPEEGEELSDVPTPEEIEKYAQEENLAGTMTTDATGYAFLELPRGTYLVVEELNADKVKATADPFYVTLPSPVEQTDDEGNVTIVYEDVVTVYVENTPIDEPGTVSVELEVTKEFEDWGKADTFRFQLEAVTPDAPMPEESIATATKDKPTAVFGQIVYDEEGVYEYTITEINDGADGVTYDTTAHSVTVTVTKESYIVEIDGDVKQITEYFAEVEYDGGESLTVTNTYNPAEAEIFVQKELKGRDWQDGDEFTFTLAPVDGAPMPLDGEGNELETVVITVKDGKVYSFGGIIYEKAGIYTYTVTETKGSLNGVTYDTSDHTVTVTVSKDQETNELTAAVTYGKPNDDKTAELVTNEYEPASAEIFVQKKLSGREWKEGDEFTFTLAPVDGAPMPLDEDGNELKTVEITVKDGKVYGFGEIEYTEPGTYEYTIVETKGSLDGVTYDTSEHTVTVTVSKDDDNKLTAAVTYGKPNDDKTAELVENKFEPTEAEIFVQKELKGREWQDGDEFTFTLAPVDGAPMPLDEDGNELKTVVVTVKDGKVCGFGEIEYTEAGTYSYTIVETKGDLDGVTYDTSEHTVTVTVSKDADNKLTAAVTYGKPNDDKTAELVTNEYEPTEVVIYVQKDLTGRDWKDGDEFTFTLAPVDGAPMPLDEDGNELKTVVVTVKDGKVYGFGEIEYTEAGTYKYTITETKGSLDGVTYDTSEHTVTVVVSKDDDNALSVEITYGIPNDDETAEVITNKFEPTEAEIFVQKKLNGRDWKEGDEFTFTLKPVDGAPMPLDEDGNEMETVEITVKDGKVCGFGEIEYTEAGTYSYTIVETKGSLDGVTYDTSEHTVTVTVSKDADNKLTAAVTYGKPNDDKTAELVENKYEPTEAEIFVQKELKGREWKDGDEFSFTLAPVDGAPMPLDEDGNEMKTVVVTVKDGKVYGFGEITYTEAGTYKYTIVETKGSLDGVAYDTSEHSVTVTVSKDDDNALSAEVTYSSPNEDKTAELVTNEYAPASGRIQVQKELKGREWKDGDEFTFTLAPVDGAPMPLDEDGNELKTVEITVKDGKVYGFGEIEYTEAGTYSYTITETKGDLDGMTYDTKSYTVTVNVAKNEDNELIVTVVYEDEDASAQVITNEFEPTEEEIFVQKELKGREWQDGDEFSFTLAPVDGAPMPLDEDGNEMKTVAVTVKDGKVYGFGKIIYEEAGTYKYTIVETKGDLDGVTYDTSEHTVTVTVAKDADNKLTASVTYGKPNDDKTAELVTNEFEPTEAEIFVQKELKGREWKDGDEFTFTLAPVDGAPMPLDEDGNEMETAQVTVKDGKVYGFGEITYTEAGTYKYTIVETKGSLDGVVYDIATHNVTVEVSKDADNKLTAAVTYGNPNEEKTAELITNEFAPASGQIYVQKELKGRDWKDGDEFTFTLAPVDGAPMPLDEDGNEMETAVVTVTGNGVYGFGLITYEEAGTYKYTITETKGDLDGMTYDTKSYTVTVNVTKDADNKLSVEVIYEDEDASAQVITNEFEPTEAEIFVQKELKGRDWEDGDEFTFTLAPVDGAPMPLDEDGNELKTVEITVKDGKVYGFGEIEYTEAGTYKYTIVETKGSLDGVAYDTSEHTVTVVVSKDDDNALSVEITYGNPNEDKTAELVTNEFTPTEAEIFVQKDLTGRDWEDGDEFTFTLAPVDGAPMPLDEDGNEMETAQVTVKDGKVYGFGEITYTEAGTYKYTIVETKGDLDGVAYDTSEHTVTVVVSKADDNALSVEITYGNPNEDKTAELVTNEFTPTEAEIFVQKDLTGRDWEDGDEFTFTLAPVDGAPMPLDEDGNEMETIEVTVKDGKVYGFG